VSKTTWLALQTLWHVRLNPNRLIAIFGGAMAAIVCGFVIITIWILSISATSLDRTQEAGERRLLGSVIGDYQKTLAKYVVDYTAWTELYDHFQEAPRSTEWENSNLGPYITATFGINHVFVTAKDGRIVYSYSPKPVSKTQPPSAADKRTLARLTQLAFRLEQPDNQVAAVGVIEMNGVPCLAAASTIRTTSLKSPSHFSLIEVREIDKTFLGQIGRDYGISGLHIWPQQFAGLALFTPGRARSAYNLAWQPSKAGHVLFVRVLPTVIAVGTVSALAFLALAFLWWRIVQLIRSGETRVFRAELEASRARANAAEETSKSKSTLIANMSHELRTPLNAIIGFAEVMSSQALGPVGVPKYREYLADIQNSGRHLLGIVEDVLQVSRLEGGKFEPAMEAVALNETVCESVRMFEVIAAKRAVNLNMSLDSQDSEVCADRQALQQILINIISNAVKFSPDHGRVDISSADLDSECELCVRDYGCGIPAKTLREIGKPFVQAEEAYSRKYPGTGLGLAICFQLAKATGASIEVTSTEGCGTAVKVRIKKTQSQPLSASGRTVLAA
jgi:signal transduction histidine kinase